MQDPLIINEFKDRIEYKNDKYYGFIQKPDGGEGVFDGSLARVKSIINLYRRTNAIWETCK